MQTFADWVATLQQHNLASSYAKTDLSDSDSDTRSCHDVQCKPLMKDTQRRRRRTAPISIPAQRHSQSIDESPDLSYYAERHLLPGKLDIGELDDDDLVFGCNFAFFRLQHGASHARTCMRDTHSLKSDVVALTPAYIMHMDGSDDEDIFTMEL